LPGERFNARLGIEGGISVLGYERYRRTAKRPGADSIVSV